MQRKLLSPKFTPLKIFLILIIIFCPILAYFDDYNSIADNIGGILFFILFPLTFIFYLSRLQKVEFDKEFLYLEKNKTIEKIPLESIYEIRYSPLCYAKTIPSVLVIKILYSNLDINKSVRVMPYKFDALYGEFEKQVVLRNPQVNIQTFYIWYAEK